MSVPKKSLISQRTAVQKAILATPEKESTHFVPSVRPAISAKVQAKIAPKVTAKVTAKVSAKLAVKKSVL